MGPFNGRRWRTNRRASLWSQRWAYYIHLVFLSGFPSSQTLLARPRASLLPSPFLYRALRLSSLLRALTYTRLQPSFTLVLPQASRHGIFPFALPLFFPRGPWIHILRQGFPPSLLYLFPLVQKSPPYLDPLRPFALHPPSLKVKMA